VERECNLGLDCVRPENKMKKQQLQETIDFLKSNGITNPEIGIVLGTGLGKLVDEISIEKEI